MADLVAADEIIERSVFDGARVMVGGFGLAGMPLTLVAALNRSSKRDLTIITNNLAEQGTHLGRALLLGKVRHVIGSYFTTNPDVGRAHAEGRLQVTLIPQGTFAEAMRAAGAGLGGFYTPTGVGTALAQGKETKEIGGKQYLFEEPLAADVALIRAYRADRLGNLVYYKTARNFNPVMATAARTVIAEVDEVVETGALDPECIVTPHLYVDHLVLATERL